MHLPDVIAGWETWFSPADEVIEALNMLAGHVRAAAETEGDAATELHVCLVSVEEIMPAEIAIAAAVRLVATRQIPDVEVSADVLIARESETPLTALARRLIRHYLQRQSGVRFADEDVSGSPETDPGRQAAA